MSNGEKSFSLFETVIAVGMLAVVLLQVTGIQGQVVYSVEYSRRLSEGIWLAQGIMARLEYEWQTRDFSELELTVNEKKIGDDFWGKDATKIFTDYSYKISSEEWKLPIFAMLTGEGQNNQEGGPPVSNLITDQIKQIFNDHMIKIATVEVLWPEGARKSSTSLSMILVNQRALDMQILAMQSSAVGNTSESPNDQAIPPDNKTDKKNQPPSDNNEGNNKNSNKAAPVPGITDLPKGE
ncbi:MAG: hypothetical protein OXC40_03015 [Proteobacteria bacterium]|nr:hypothetical protein [Pseudomonadota bacterium]